MYKRFLFQKIKDALIDTPAIWVQGARQVGKSTLATALEAEYQDQPVHCYTLDDTAVLDRVKYDPVGFINRSEGLTVIDEIQRCPELLLPIKKKIDDHRRPAQFLLTGSANVFLIPKVADSLTGRVENFNLWPLSIDERIGENSGFIDWCFSSLESPIEFQNHSFDQVLDWVLRGGYPEAIARSSDERRMAWFDSYLNNLFSKDVHDVANIDRLMDVPKLFSLLAARASCLYVQSELSDELQISQSSIKKYITILEALFVCYRLKPWMTNIGSRLIKSPKIMISDTGLLCHSLQMDRDYLLNHPQQRGHVVENFVVNEVMKQSAWSKMKVNAYFMRTSDKKEIDLILENRRGEVVAIEIKARATIKSEDFKVIKFLKDKLKDRFHKGIVIYMGDSVQQYSDDLFALPLSCLFSSRVC